MAVSPTDLTAAKNAKISATYANTTVLLEYGFPLLGTRYSLGMDGLPRINDLKTSVFRGDTSGFPSLMDVLGVYYTPTILSEATEAVSQADGYRSLVLDGHNAIMAQIAAATTVAEVDAITDDRTTDDPPVFEGVASRARVATVVPPKPRWKLNCTYLGERVDPACGSRVRRCDLFGTTTSQVVKDPNAERFCQDCRFFVQGGPKADKPPKPRNVVSPVSLDLSKPRVGGKLVLTTAVGGNGRTWLGITRPLMEAYAEKVGAAFDVIEGGDENYPLGEKWRIGEYVRRYDRVLFLDADVVVAPDCSDLFAEVPVGSLGVRDDWPWLCTEVGVNVTRKWMDPEVLAIRKAAARPGPRLSTCYNTGVMVLSPRHADLFDPPKVPLPKYHCTEQHWFNLNVLDKEPTMYELPWELHWHPFIDRKGVRTEGVKVWHLAGEDGREDKLRLLVEDVTAGRVPLLTSRSG